VIEQPTPAMIVRDFVGFLAVDEKTNYHLAEKGKFPWFRMAGAWRFQLRDLQNWIDLQERASTGRKVKTAELSS